MNAHNAAVNTAPLRVVDDVPAAAAAPRKTAVILINIGTPDAPDTAAVRRYLDEFLGDPRVLDIGALQRFLLLKLVILPFRSPKSAAQYKTIWTDRGSPLMFHTEDVAQKLRGLFERAQPPQRAAGETFEVSVGMRYGNPSLASALAKAAQSGASRVVLVPMFPQYASASTGSALELAYDILGKLARVPDVSVVPPFFDDGGFLDSVAATITDVVGPNGSAGGVDHVLFSYHGLPLHQVQAVHASCRGTEACCDKLTLDNASCYRAQCMWTTRALVKRAQVGAHSTSFQSRLGKAVWLLPNTEHVVADLAKGGVKKLAVACPSFVADCLETVEEIGVRARETFAQAGGEELFFIPCVNARDDFVQAVERMVRRAVGEVGA